MATRKLNNTAFALMVDLGRIPADIDLELFQGWFRFGFLYLRYMDGTTWTGGVHCHRVEHTGHEWRTIGDSWRFSGTL